MRIKYKIPLMLFSATVVVTAFVAYSNYSTNVDLIESAKRNELKIVATQIENNLIDQGNSAASKVALVVQRPDVKALFKQQNRAGLMELIKPSFTTLKNKYGVREMQFNLLPAQVFLRMHNPAVFGDDDSSFREMILMAVKNKKTYQGLEVGRSGINIRAIEPIEDEQGLIGTFEVGMSLGTILDDIKKNTGFEAAIFINDSLMTRVATSRSRPGPERIFGELQGIGATDWSKILPFMKADVLNRVNNITMETQNINGKDYGMILMPLMDFKNNEIGVIVAMSDFSQYQSELRTSLIKNISYALFEIIILVGILRIAIRVLVLRPLKHINNTLRDWDNGQADKSMGVLTQKDDELGWMAASLESLHKKCRDKERDKDKGGVK